MASLYSDCHVFTVLPQEPCKMASLYLSTCIVHWLTQVPRWRLCILIATCSLFNHRRHARWRLCIYDFPRFCSLSRSFQDGVFVFLFTALSQAPMTSMYIALSQTPRRGTCISSHWQITGTECVSSSFRPLTNHSHQLQDGVLVFLFIVYWQAPRWRLCISVHCLYS